MPLKKFEQLTKDQQEKVKVMYSDTSTVEQYLYNFDDNGDYHGRQYVPPEGVDEEKGLYGTVHAQEPATEPKVTEEQVEEIKHKRTAKKK